MSTTKADNSAAPRGFDSPVVAREGDHLNRWPLAREIVGIATTGPKAWSVRVGIYGEWGTGKTSVLKFVDSMAEQAGHIVIWFDPWQYSNKPELWQAFVLAVYEQVKSKLGDFPGVDDAKFKTELAAMKKVAGIVLGKRVGEGLDLLKKYFTLSGEDLNKLQAKLGNRRIIVLIDDLDRTAPELVPEILFALKELMDIPAFSFICAFDPIVVGEVLGKYHPGFRDGIKFLDKIIDYPRWLPPTSGECLAKLAVADAKLSCPYVPENAIRNAIPLLPANPRAVRQFIRILSLLKSQIQRHYDSELCWPAIIGANILKVRHPRVAHELLGDASFWNSIGFVQIKVHNENVEDKISDAIDKQIVKICESAGVVLDSSQKKEIKIAMVDLASQMGMVSGLHGESTSYQFNIAEAPAAVTWKEFDLFLARWETNPIASKVKEWIATHASEVQRKEVDVYRETLRATVQRYGEALHRADNVLVEADKPSLLRRATAHFALLKSLCFELAEPESIGYDELSAIVERFASFAKSSLPAHRQYWSGNELFILTLFEKWSGDVTTLLKALEPYAGFLPHGFEGAAAAELRNKLIALALPQFARQVMGNLRESGFVRGLISRQEGTLDSRRVILDMNGPVWTTLRKETLKILAEAPNRAVQENAYELLHWFVLARAGEAPADFPNLKMLLSDQEIFDAIWNAANATALGPRAVYQIRDLPEIAKPLGIKFETPAWWQNALVSAGIIEAPVAAAVEQAQ